jgi:hypothetical protein
MKKTYKNFNNLMKKKHYIKFFYHLKIKILNNILNTKNLKIKLIIIENKNFSLKHFYYNQTRCLVI